MSQSRYIGAAAPVADTHERRAEPRVRANNAPARLFYGAGLAYYVDCQIRDRSKSGAKIQAPALFDLPNQLVLLDFEQGFAFEAELRWRKAEMAGLWLHKGHDLATTTDPALAEVKKTFDMLGPGLGCTRR